MHKKQLPKFLYLVLILGLLLVEGLAFSQDGNQAEAPPQEEHNGQELEDLLKKYNKDAEKVIEDTSKLHNIQEGEAKSEMSDSELEEVKLPTAAEEAQALKHTGKKGEKPKVLPTDFSSSVRMALEPLQKLSEADLMKRLDEGLKDSEFRPYIEEIPNLKLLMVRLIKDKESLPSMVQIVENKDRLIYFASAMLFSIILGFILKRAMHREGRPFVIAAIMFLLRTAILLAVRLAIIQYFFGKEIAPALKVFKQTFMDS